MTSKYKKFYKTFPDLVLVDIYLLNSREFSLDESFQPHVHTCGWKDCGHGTDKSNLQ